MTTQPDNLDLLSPLGFQFIIKRLPTVQYFTQTVTLPTITMNPVDNQTTPFGIIPHPGDRLTYDPLTITFKVNEDLVNYIEIENWLTGMTHPESFEQTRQFVANNPAPFLNRGNRPVDGAPWASLVSDATLLILTNHNNPNINVVFEDLFPISLTELTFDTKQQNFEYLEATVTFRYRKYKTLSV